MQNESANSSLGEESAWADISIPYTVCEILVSVAAIIGNALVIAVFGRERKLRRRTKYYIISLAVADFLVGLLGIPFAILASVGLPRNFYLCLFTVSTLVVLCTISIFCLVAVSIDRYWAILYPMSYSRNVRSRTAIGIIIVCWLAGALVGFLPLLGWHQRRDYDKCLFVEVMDYNYLVFLYFATIIVPALLLAAFYAHIYQVVLKQLRQIVLMSPVSLEGRSTSPQRSSGVMLRVLGAAQKREVKATQNLSIIVLFFIVCWIPLYTINCVKAFCPECTVSPKLTYFCIILSHLNSSLNPFLYAYHLKDFRAALHKLIFKSEERLDHPPNFLRYDSTLHLQRNELVTVQTTPNSPKDNVEKTTNPKTNGVSSNHLWTLPEVPSTSEEESVKYVGIDNFVYIDEDDEVFADKTNRRLTRRSHSLYELENIAKHLEFRDHRSFSESYTLNVLKKDLLDAERRAGVELSVRKLQRERGMAKSENESKLSGRTLNSDKQGFSALNWMKTEDKDTKPRSENQITSQ